MILALTLIAASALSQAPSDTTGEVLLAVTEQGVRIQVAEEIPAGSKRIPTGFGLYSTDRDPVARTISVKVELGWLEDLERQPQKSLLPVIQRLEMEGRLAELVAIVPILRSRFGEREEELSQEAERRHRELLFAIRALERWGEHIDPIPSEKKHEKRIEKLWEAIAHAKGASALLVSGRLLSEIHKTKRGIGNKLISLMDLRKGMKSRSPYVRRASGQVSGREFIVEPHHGELLLLQSIEDRSVLARDGAAMGLAEVWSRDARNFWKHVLGGVGNSFERIRAARHLVYHAEGEALTQLIYAINGTRSGSAEIGGLRRLAQKATRDFEVTQAMVDIELRANQAAPRVSERLMCIPLPRRKMTTRLLAAVIWHIQELAGDGIERSPQQWQQWLKSGPARRR